MGIPTAIHSTSNAIPPQQERTKPSGPRPCRYGAKLPPQRELTYQEICYVVIQAKGLSFSTMLGKNKLGLPEGRRDFFANSNGDTDMVNSHGRFVWYELMTTDMKTAKLFYANVVGWGAR